MFLAEIVEPQVLDELQELKEVKPNEIAEYLKGFVPEITDFGINILIAILIFFLGRKLISILIKILTRSFERAEWEGSVIDFLSTIINVILHGVLILIIIDRFGIQTTSLITLIGSAGLAIGLALQGSLSNFAGGVLILLLKPFRVGDYIIEDNNKNEGTVAKIDLFYTKLMTLDNKVIIIPNGSLANTSLTNVSTQDKRRIDIKIGIAYNADLRKAKNIILELLQNDEKVLKDQPMMVYVDSIGESSVMIGSILWVETAEFFSTKCRLTENIKTSLDENQIEIPHNKLDVHLTTKVDS